MNGETSPQKKRQTPHGAKTSSGDGGKDKAVGRAQGKPKVSFALSVADDEDDDPPDWQHMSIEEMEDATLDIRRQMWELHPVAEGD